MTFNQVPARPGSVSQSHLLGPEGVPALKKKKKVHIYEKHLSILCEILQTKIVRCDQTSNSVPRVNLGGRIIGFREAEGTQICLHVVKGNNSLAYFALHRSQSFDGFLVLPGLERAAEDCPK